MTQLFNLMIEVMLPLALLVAAGAVWPLIFRDTPVEAMRTQLNRLVLYVFYPCILFAVVAQYADHEGSAVSAAAGGHRHAKFRRAALRAAVPDAARPRALRSDARDPDARWHVRQHLQHRRAGRDVLLWPRRRALCGVQRHADDHAVIWSLGVWIATRLGSHEKPVSYPSLWRILLSLPPLWAFALGLTLQALDLTYKPLVEART